VNVAIAAGGTGGHVNPAIALGHGLTSDAVTFVGTGKGAEAALVPAAGFDLEIIDVRGFDRSRPLSLFAVAPRAIGAMLSARGILKRKEIDVCVGMGGFVSLPVCYAARSMGIPVVIHEQNIVLGLANRASKPIARVVAVSFEESLESAGPRAIVVGNPVPPEMAVVDLMAERARGWERFALDSTRRTLLVFGGSQGAHTINQAAIGLARLWADNLDLQILHIAGAAEAAKIEREVGAALEGNRLIYKVVEYVDRMVEAYAVADLALCRGGATTVAELCALGLSSVIIPYPHHRDQQQQRHASLLESHGACTSIADAEASTERVAEEVSRLLHDDFALQQMRKAALSLGHPDAALRLAELVWQQAP
jgi:UDP-N-acetylglucosamine--N-acetylmuramyl-(pentapeptide) pyrophosphoryl-undecaprenol N-acetylglucosamine transferase